ncbi:CdaR family transcriptional regulator [Homoserinimonas sp. OAct 916]|uniref:PucR family transcriptional regulator n=1 Tax=Homoserinimonas sp. OAct 916 TaxID=2211450 RepID=UPI000DBE6F9A|nr:helix-turn-helix domain-containing protein [Homoserinimonas sp. OAct 916]
MSSFQSELERFSRRVQRALAVDDTDFVLIAHTAGDGREDGTRVESILYRRTAEAAIAHGISYGIDTATEPVRLPANESIGYDARVCVPLVVGAVRLGYLWVIDNDDSLQQWQYDALSSGARALSASLYATTHGDGTQITDDRWVVTRLLSDDPTDREAARLVVEEGWASAPVLGVVFTAAAGADHDQLTSALTRTFDGLKTLAADVTETETVLLVANTGMSGTFAHDVLSRASAALHKLNPATGAPVWCAGVGPRVEELDDIRTSVDRARLCLHLADRMPGFGTVVAWSDLGAYHVLLQLPLDNGPSDLVDPRVRRLIDADSTGQLVATLESYLRSGGSPKAVSDELHIHRASLYYRLSRITEICGLSPADGDDRFQLDLGLRMARLTGLLT